MFEMLRDKFSGDDGKDRLYGLGLLASQLGSGQAPNAGPALQMLKERQSRNALKQQMQGGDFMGKFSDQEQAFLATLPPEAAQQLIAQRVFAQPTPVAGTEINGQLVNPQTGELMGDFRSPDAPEPVRGVEINGKLVNPITGEEIADYSGGGSVSYIASGDAAQSLGLDPKQSYNITSGPEGMKAQAIGGGPLVTIDQSQGEVGTISPGYELFTNPNGAREMRPIAGGPEDTTSQTQASDATIQDSISLIDSVMSDPALSSITGMLQGSIPPVTQGGTDLNVKIDQIKGQAFLNAFEQLKGGGTITEREGQAATQAVARLNRAQSTEAFQAALADLRYVLERGLSREANPNASLPEYSLPSEANKQRLVYDPATGEFK